MIDIIKSKRNYIIAIAVLFVFVSLSETTYSLFLQSNTTQEFNYKTGLLDLEFVEDEQITLESAFPTNDSEALKQEPYKLTIKNTGSLAYYFDLIMISSNVENAIDNNYIKIKVDNNLPQTLSYEDNVISKNNIIYPGEEITFKIYIWLDINTPNKELGKVFSAKVITSGTSIYKTQDTSGANHPDIKDNMVPVYYDESSSTWKKADNTNISEANEWYNYANSKWANVVTLKETNKKIYDIKRYNDLTIDNIIYNNGNIIIDEDYLDLNLSNYSYNTISTITRVNFKNLSKDNIYIMSNDLISYYYDNINKTFVFKNGNQKISSSNYNIEGNKWYILGFTYDSNKVTFYVDGTEVSSGAIYGGIRGNKSFKLGTDSNAKEISNITVGNLLIYNRVLTSQEISKNYKTSVEVISDGLLCGYTEFIPMTLEEYYLSRKVGTEISEGDISSFFVWIPRYEYKVWNVTGENNIDSYNAYDKGIDIVFENNTNSSGNIKCDNTNCYVNNILDPEVNNGNTPVTSENNNLYYTHPAFSLTSKELTGLWVSKYELSIDSSGKVESKKNNYAWKDASLSTYYEAVKKLNDNNYSIIKNTEWGAVAYLSHSKYGLCTNDKCENMSSNNTYTSGADKYDTTTNNVYGVFDMSGSVIEYTMANISQDDNLNLSNTLFSGIPISNDDYNLYKNNTFILGDATKEISNGNIASDNNNNWIIRGNITSQNKDQIFSYTTTDEMSSGSIGTRMTIK